MVDQVEAAQEAKPREELLNFCPRCFASDDGGSWGAGTVDLQGGGSHCLNCGAGCSPSLQLPRWAIESIRSQASWVGRRYYPGEEDRDNHTELKALRALPKTFPGRTAEKIEKEPYTYWVKQQLGKNKSVMSTFKASSPEDAIEASRFSLPYVPAEALK